MIKRVAIVAHRWLGVAFCVLFFTWFLSGIGMMYWDYPAVTAADRLARSSALDPSRIVVAPGAAFASLSESQPVTGVRLNTFDGRPVYRFRTGRREALVYADTGERQRDASSEMMRRTAAAWTGLPASASIATAINEVDQWTLEGPLRTMRPLWTFSWPSGEQVYISQASGEVVQFTTTASRIQAYLGPIPHWVYFTPLRKHGPQWSTFIIWSSGLATVSALLGLVIGIWIYSPSKRYRRHGAPTSIPYAGQKRWHLIFGLIFGVASSTWAFSGMLSMEPFPLRTSSEDTGEPVGALLARALREPIQLDAFSPERQRQALAQLASRSVKELEFASIAGDLVFVAVMDGGDTRLVPLDGSPTTELGRQNLADILAATASTTGGVDVSVLDQYDAYYEDRRRERPLPVLLAEWHDAARTRAYIDPKTARIVGMYDSGDWVSRWLYHGLHSFDFPWLYNHRPAWDIVVITFMLGGATLSATALMLAWRVVAARLGALINRR